MSVKWFLDTNILVYACDSSHAAKQQTGLALISETASRDEGVISTQVLGEFFHATAIRRKLLTSEEAERAVLAFEAALIVAAVEPRLVTEAIKVHRRYQTRYWDSLNSPWEVAPGKTDRNSFGISKWKSPIGDQASWREIFCFRPAELFREFLAFTNTTKAWAESQNISDCRGVIALR